MCAATFKPQSGPVFVGSGAKKEGEILGIGLPKLGSRQQNDLDSMKKFAKDASVKHFLQQQNVAHQQNQQKVQMYAQALSLMARVYIGSISFEVREEQIKETFSAFGPIKSINMSWDAITGHHKGFAFLEFEVPEAAILAQETMNGRIMGGRNLKVGKPSNIPQAQPIIENVTAEAKKYHRVYVASVHPDLSETDLMGVFEPFGTIIKCQLAKQLGGKGHRGFGYLEYTTTNAATEAISALNNFDLGGMTLRVGKCITPPDALTYVIPSSQSNLPSAAAMAAASVTASIKQKEVKKTASPNENSPAAISNKPFFEKSQSPFTSSNECSNDGIPVANKPRKRRGFGAQVTIIPPPAVIANPLTISQSTTFPPTIVEEKSTMEQNGNQNNDCIVNSIKLPDLPKPGEIATWAPVNSTNSIKCNSDNNICKKEDEEILAIQNDAHSTALVVNENSNKNSTEGTECSKMDCSEEEEKHKSKRSRRGKSSKKHRENDHEAKSHKQSHSDTNSTDAIKNAGAVSDQINQVKLNNEEISLAHQEKCEIKGNEARYLLMNKLMRKIKSSVIVLRNMVTLPEVDDLLEHEIKEECSKYGEIKDICLFNEPETINVRVFILFRSPEEAECAKNALDKRFFACKKISASIYDQILYESGDYMGLLLHKNQYLQDVLKFGLEKYLSRAAIACGVSNMDAVKGCIFCDLLQTKKEAILKENDDLAIIKDIKPHAKYHYLVLSKKHIGKIGDVCASDIDFIKKMESIGREFLRLALKSKGEADIVEDMLRIGFHQWPLLTVKHLHMHILYPISSMNIATKHVIYKPGRFFKPVTEVLVEMQEELLKSDNTSPAAKEMKEQHKASINPAELAEAITGKD